MLSGRPSPSWERFAGREPYFAVLTDPKYLAANFDDEARAAFFDSGTKYVDFVLDVIRNRIAPTRRPESLLELGCGPGRLALAFSTAVSRVTAVDISPAMLAVARDNATAVGAGNIEFQTLEEYGRSDSEFDLVNACLVFHHVAPKDGYALIADMLRRLKPGGVAVIEFPVHDHSGNAAQALRWLRTHVPPANVAANVLRRKPSFFPLIHPRPYSRSAVLSLIRAAGCDQPHLIPGRHGDTEVLTAFAQKPAVAGQQPAAASPPIDVKQLMAASSLEELNRKAEEYFATITDREPHLSKPFASVQEAPALLLNVAILLQGLRLNPGLTVLELGAGTGWLSRFLTQLGCRSILLDVSPTALEIAAELFQRMPVIGSRPAPQFLLFDGRRIDLPEESVDRIVCFDAFHHVPNPGEVLRELARILKPGGIAAFAEPGPDHSKSLHSQFEMQTFGVVENDVDIAAIWAEAQQAGFARIELAAFNGTPFRVSLDEYEQLLAGGEAYERFGVAARAFLSNVRDFFLYKPGEVPIDSRTADALAAAIDVEIATEFPAGEALRVRATVTNRGRAVWLPSGQSNGAVSLGCHLYDAGGALLDLEYHREALSTRPMARGESVTVTFELPPLAAGVYFLEFDCVAEPVAWFARVGSETVRMRVEIAPVKPQR
jgi:ubiquinone/menaquinone biosynthesis C-methylase UbiE